MTTLLVVRHAFRLGACDYRAIFTWRSWLTGWFVRVLAQVAFFALLGRLTGVPGQVSFLLVGNAVMVAAMVGMYAVNMVSWERSTGALPLLAAGPTHPAVVFVSRGTYLIADGTVSATSALVVGGYLFGVPPDWSQMLVVVPLIVLVAASTFCFGTFAGGLLLGYRSIESVVTNVGVVSLMTLCGVDVALDGYPGPVRLLSDLLPLTHGLAGVRLALDGRLAPALAQGAQEALVGLGWLTVCLLTFTAIVRRGRRLGTLDHAT